MKKFLLVWIFSFLLLAGCGADNVTSDESLGDNDVELSSSSSAILSSADSSESWEYTEIFSSSSVVADGKSAPVLDSSVYDAANNTLTDLRDGRVYRTVVIGPQIWMAENLSFKTDSSVCGLYNPEDCTKYGRYYLWDDAMNEACSWETVRDGESLYTMCIPKNYPVRGLCPAGWHLPDTLEWYSLIRMAGYYTAGRALKSVDSWDDYKREEYGNGLDVFSFSVLPTGSCFESDCGGVGRWAYYWIAAPGTTGSGLSAVFENESFGVNDGGVGSKGFYMSVRCLHDSSGIDTVTNKKVYYSSAPKEAGSVYDADENTLTDLRDGHIYKTVTIGSQIWMAENVSFEMEFARCDSYSVLRRYGCLYLGMVADVACPDGWHLPNNEEWKELISAVGDSLPVGMALKSTNSWWESASANKGEDVLSFDVLPAGYCKLDDYDCITGSGTGLWSASTEPDAINSRITWSSKLSFSFTSDDIKWDRGLFWEPGSVRCLKNK